MSEIENRQDFSDLEFTSEDEFRYFQTAMLGEQFRTFLTSQVGRMLHTRAIKEVEEAKLELLQCDPTTDDGVREILRLQRKADIADSFMRWCADAISDGEEAYAQMEEIRSE